MKTIEEALRSAAGAKQITFEHLRAIVEAIQAENAMNEKRVSVQFAELRAQIAPIKRFVESNRLPIGEPVQIVGVQPNINERD